MSDPQAKCLATSDQFDNKVYAPAHESLRTALMNVQAASLSDSTALHKQFAVLLII